MSKGKKTKKPISKKTQSLLNDLQRKRGVRELAKRFLIVCEDDKSAPNYFQSLKKHFNLSATSIVVAGSDGHTQPIQVVKRAIMLKDNSAKADGGTEPFDQVWCVIDGDYGSKIHNARASATANGIELAISTQCFEYWVLLHFEESATPAIDCDAVIHILKRKKYFPDYEKGKCDFNPIVVNVHEACKRAAKLRKPSLAARTLPEDQNPCSEVYKLVNAILDA